MTVRAARVEDAEAIAEVHVAGWQGAYTGLMPADFLAAQTVEKRTPRWRSILGAAPPEKRHAVVEREGKILGFASSGPCRDEDADAGSAGELWALYAHPRAWGTGVGRDLMLDALAFFRERTNTRAVIWVLRGNDRALAFYQRFGFALDGRTKTEDGLAEVRLVLELSRSA